MKPESLHALIIDRHFGELTPEAVELLEHHLAANTHARAEAERILESLQITHDAVLQHPELVRVAVTSSVAPQTTRQPAFVPWLARAAAILLLAALTGAGGFFAGRSNSPTTTASGGGAPEPRRESPWAQYRMSFDPAGEGMQVVRVDTKNLETKSLP